MITKSHFILYVADQLTSTEFYSKLLDQKPSLNVPGMTEFELTEKSILGLMPVSGIMKLLGVNFNTPIRTENIVPSELYIVVKNIEEYLVRAKLLKVKIINELKERDWQHKVVYFLDPDGYIIALAETIND